MSDPDEDEGTGSFADEAARLLGALRARAKPEVIDHLADALGSLAAAVTALLAHETGSDSRPESGSDRRAESRSGTESVEHIEVTDDEAEPSGREST